MCSFRLKLAKVIEPPRYRTPLREAQRNLKGSSPQNIGLFKLSNLQRNRVPPLMARHTMHCRQPPHAAKARSDSPAQLGEEPTAALNATHTQILGVIRKG